jgi:hypothetical protein
MMRIPLATRFREPVCAIGNRLTSKWLGFLKIDLLNPHIDKIALLKGDRIFTLQLRNEFVIGKVEKGFYFTSTSVSRKIKIQSPVLTTFTSCHLLADLIQMGYSSGHNMEIAGISKRSTEQDHAKITLVTETAKDLLMCSPIFLAGVRVTTSTSPHDTRTKSCP